MKTQKIKVRGDIKLPEIIQDLERGKLKIPAFQRQYVWEKSKVRDLLDSIYNEFPIGTFFVWSAPNEYKKFFRDIPELNLPHPHQHENLDFILDGQQRIISLYVVIKGLSIGNKDYSQICFDLEKEQFVIKFRPANYQIPVYKILNPDINQFDIFEKLDYNHKEPFSRCINTFNTYPLSMVNVLGNELAEAIEIFERINQGGKKLSLFDLVAASTWSPNFDLRHRYENLKKDFHSKGYDDMPPEIILFTLGLCVKGRARNSALLEIKNVEVEKSWDDIVDAINLAMDYLSKNQGVKLFSFLPYPAIVSLLAYLYYKNNKKSLTSTQTEYIHKWFWKTALSERYASSVQTYLEEDKKYIMNKILKDKDPNLPFHINLTPERIKFSRLGVKSALRNSLFCLLALKEPKNFKNNEKIELNYNLCASFNNSQKHHIFPVAYLKGKGIGNFNSLANFCFIPEQLNKEISNKKPSDYFARYKKDNESFQKTLNSHLIPWGDFIENNDYDQFLGARAKMIYEEFEKMIGESILRNTQDNENESIDSLEEKLRKFIHRSLKEGVGGDYWNKSIPGDLQENIKNRVNQHKKNYPNESIDFNDNKKLLEFADVMDYYKIISSNFEHFKDIFSNVNNLEKRFLQFKEYRNRVKHQREITSVVKKEGEAAIEWIYNTIKNNAEVKNDESLEDGQNKKIICDANDVEAKGEWLSGNKVQVKKNSMAHGVEADSFKSHNYKKMRDELIKNGILRLNGSHYVFNQDYTFDSPSAAAAIVLGRAANGRDEWKTLDGIPISQLK